MIDISNEGLLPNNNKNMLSIESISEKQEESSNSSGKNTKMMKSIKKNKSISKQGEISKDAMDISDLSIRKKRKVKKSSICTKKRKSFKDNTNEEEKDKDKEKPKFNRKEKKKNSQLIAPKRTSFQNDNFHSFYNKLKNAEEQKKNASSNVIEKEDINIKRTVLKDKKSLNVSLNTNKPNPFYSMYNKNNSIIGQTMVKNKSVNLSNSELLDMKYFTNKKIKNTILKKGKLNLKEEKKMSATTLFERLRGSYLFEKSEAILFKIKICYGFLGIFSFLSIILEISDVVMFNQKSVEFLKINYNIDVSNDNNINNYYFIQKRKITKRENTIRTFNLVFSVLCFFVHLIIHFIKNNFDKQTKKKKKNNYYKYYNYNQRRKTKRLDVREQNTSNDNHFKLIVNNDLLTKSFVTREEIIKLVINCFISLIFYPPGLNKVFIGIHHNVIFVYSLNCFFLLISFFKLTNIYFAFYYLSPFNNLLYKTICSSNMVKMDFKFMFKFLLNLYPFSFILTNFIIIGLVISLLLYCSEYFSINVRNGIENNKGKNDLKSFYNELYLFCLFIIKYVHGNIKTETIFGSFVLLIGGTIGLVIISYFIYDIHQFIAFKPDEQEAYSKLVKLLNPINNEHKSSNLIKIVLLLKKMYFDNKNIENEYKSKKENNIKSILQKNFGLRKSNFNFDPNESTYSTSNLGENYEYKEKKKFIKFICSQFVLHVKLIIESKNFKNNLLIARNYSLSFNDVLKTLGDKMNGNLNQLNIKLESLFIADQKYRNFMKFQNNSIKKLKKILVYQNFLIDFLIEKNNEISISYIEDNKIYQNNFKNKYKNIAQGGGGYRRMKSSFNGQFFSFNKKPSRKKSLDDQKNKGNVKQSPKELFDQPKKIEFKRLRSSIFRKKTDFKSKIEVSRSRTYPIKIVNKNQKKSKSFDDNLFKVAEKRKKIIEIDKNEIEKIKKKRYSLLSKRKEVISKWINKMDI